MSVAQQFMTFLVDQLDTKVGVIEKHTQSESARSVASETKLYVAQLRQMIPQIFDGGEPPRPKRATVRRRQSEANVNE